jgi:hypothetical protein
VAGVHVAGLRIAVNVLLVLSWSGGVPRVQGVPAIGFEELCRVCEGAAWLGVCTRCCTVCLLAVCGGVHPAVVCRYDLVSGGTDNHLVLVNLNPKGIDGARVEATMDKAKLAANKNTVPGDKSALVPGGIRMGTPALTSRGFTPADFVKVAGFFDRTVQIAQSIAKSLGPGHKLADFKASLNTSPPAELKTLQDEVRKPLFSLSV